jgi:hypothetical protein
VNLVVEAGTGRQRDGRRGKTDRTFFAMTDSAHDRSLSRCRGGQDFTRNRTGIAQRSRDYCRSSDEAA